MHDRIDELAGLSVELWHCTRNAPHRVDQIRTAIDRVRGELERHADGLEKRAKDHLAAGQDMLAEEDAESARQIRWVLADAPKGHEDQPKERAARGSSGKRTTKAASPPERT